MSNKRSDEIEERKRGCGGHSCIKKCSWCRVERCPKSVSRWQREVTGRSGTRLLDTGRDSLDITAEVVCNRWKIQIPTFPTIISSRQSCQAPSANHRVNKFHTLHPYYLPSYSLEIPQCAMYGVHARNTRRNRNHGRLLDTATPACGRVLEQLPMTGRRCSRTVSNPVQSVFRLTIIGLSAHVGVSIHRLLNVELQWWIMLPATFWASTTTPQPATTQPMLLLFQSVPIVHRTNTLRSVLPSGGNGNASPIELQRSISGGMHNNSTHAVIIITI